MATWEETMREWFDGLTADQRQFIAQLAAQGDGTRQPPERAQIAKQVEAFIKRQNDEAAAVPNALVESAH